MSNRNMNLIIEGLDNDFELKKGKVYTLKKDCPYMSVKDAEDFYYYPEEWIKGKYTKKHKGEDWIVFPKGTKLKYIFSDDLGPFFKIDGTDIPIDYEGNIGDLLK